MDTLSGWLCGGKKNLTRAIINDLFSRKKSLTSSPYNRGEQVSVANVGYMSYLRPQSLALVS